MISEPYSHEGAGPEFFIGNPANQNPNQAIADSLRAQAWAMAEIEGLRRECGGLLELVESLVAENKELREALRAYGGEEVSE